jgi:hypothetical protein
MEETFKAMDNISDLSPHRSKSLRYWVFAVTVKCDEIFTKCNPVYMEQEFSFGFNAWTITTQNAE